MLFYDAEMNLTFLATPVVVVADHVTQKTEKQPFSSGERQEQ
jgi:hypothetical protein